MLYIYACVCECVTFLNTENYWFTLGDGDGEREIETNINGILTDPPWRIAGLVGLGLGWAFCRCPRCPWATLGASRCEDGEIMAPLSGFIW